MTSKLFKHCSPEICKRVVNMLIELRDSYPAKNAAIKSIPLKSAIASTPYASCFASVNSMLVTVIDGSQFQNDNDVRI